MPPAWKILIFAGILPTLLYVNHSSSVFLRVFFFIVSLYCYQNSAGKVIQRTPYFHSHLYLPTMTKCVRQSSVRRFSVCCLNIAKLLYSLTVLKYLDNDDFISSITSLKYKQYITIIIAKQYSYTKSRS